MAFGGSYAERHESVKKDSEGQRHQLPPDLVGAADQLSAEVVTVDGGVGATTWHLRAHLQHENRRLRPRERSVCLLSSRSVGTR